MTLDQLAPRAAIQPPRDLAWPGRLLSSALALLDGFNPFPASQPGELEMAEHNRAGQVAAFLAQRDVLWGPENAARRTEWRGRYGGKEAEGPTIGVIITPKAARFTNQGFRLKRPADAAAPETGKLHLVSKRRPG